MYNVMEHTCTLYSIIKVSHFSYLLIVKLSQIHVITLWTVLQCLTKLLHVRAIHKVQHHLRSVPNKSNLIINVCK